MYVKVKAMKKQYRHLKRSGGSRGNEDPSKQWVFYRDMEDIMTGDVLNDDEGDVEESNITMVTEGEEEDEDSRLVENDAEIDEEASDEDNEENSFLSKSKQGGIYLLEM